MSNTKLIAAIVVAVLISFGAGIFLGGFLVEPVEKPIAVEELWWANFINGTVTEVRGSVVFIEADISDSEGKPIKREALVTADTTIFLSEPKLEIDEAEVELIMPPFMVSKFGKTIDEKYDGTLIDGEYVFSRNSNVTYHIFDILFYKGTDVRDTKFFDRLDYIKDFIETSPIESYYGTLELKHFEIEGNIYERLRRIAKVYEKMVDRDCKPSQRTRL